MSHRHALMTLLALGVVTTSAPAQAIATHGAERETGRTSYWRLAYDNDFFAATDRYFTQGIVIEVVSPRLGGAAWNRVLRAPRGSVTRHGLAYADDGYTASDLKTSQVLLGDHPYAGTKQLRAFRLSVDTLRGIRSSASLTLGIIGQGAGGAEIQTFIHRRTGNTIPQGWHNQIRNDLILNYETGIERELVRGARHLLVTSSATARLGTFNTAATLGTTLMVGRVSPAFAMGKKSGRSFYAYLKPQVNLVGHDATLQGGLFNRSSPYTIRARDLSRVVYRQQVGVAYRSSRWFIEYYRSFATPEFSGARGHGSGGFQVGVLR